MVYRMYIGNSLYCIMNGYALPEKYSDIINKKVETRSGDEIALDIIARAGLKVGEDE